MGHEVSRLRIPEISATCKVSLLRVAEKVSGLRVADISAGAICLYGGIITNQLKLIENVQIFEIINICLQ